MDRCKNRFVLHTVFVFQNLALKVEKKVKKEVKPLYKAKEAARKERKRKEEKRLKAKKFFSSRRGRDF